MTASDVITIIERLPQDIKTKIYKEYFEAKIIYDELKKMIKSNVSQVLYNVNIALILPKVLSNDLVVRYLLEREKEFKAVYTNEIINKPDEKVDYYNFASLWLFNIYFKDIIAKPHKLSLFTKNIFSFTDITKTITN